MLSPIERSKLSCKERRQKQKSDVRRLKCQHDAFPQHTTSEALKNYIRRQGTTVYLASEVSSLPHANSYWGKHSIICNPELKEEMKHFSCRFQKLQDALDEGYQLIKWDGVSVSALCLVVLSHPLEDPKFWSIKREGYLRC